MVKFVDYHMCKQAGVCTDCRNSTRRKTIRCGPCMRKRARQKKLRRKAGVPHDSA